MRRKEEGGKKKRRKGISSIGCDTKRRGDMNGICAYVCTHDHSCRCKGFLPKTSFMGMCKSAASLKVERLSAVIENTQYIPSLINFASATIVIVVVVSGSC